MSPYFIKVCGITNYDDAVTAIDAGATAIGFNFFKKSKRYIAPEAAKEIAEKIRGKIATVGVFVNEEQTAVKSVGALVKLTYCQFHGDETPDYTNCFPNAIKAFRVNDSIKSVYFDDYHVAAFLLDAFDEKEFGGTGKSFNWLLSREANEFGKIILAGGLTPENVAEAIGIVTPWGVDVSSGVELEPGKKDKEKVRLFTERARQAFEQTMESE
ncbi:MAG: phosphoribosylanthranilate isomerase [Bacteriovoracaceae bacterium]|nr:phosphoribosylanthranilate isomerase [Bacteroidota bacterium]